MALIHKTYQVRAYTTASGYGRIDVVLGNCAQLYNAALEEWKAAYRHKGHSLSVALSKFDQIKEFTRVRNEDPEFWGAVSVQIGRGVLTRLDRARQSFYKTFEERRDSRISRDLSRPVAGIPSRFQSSVGLWLRSATGDTS